MPESDFAQESNQDQLQEMYLKALDQIEEGGLIEGEVIQVDSEYVYARCCDQKVNGILPTGSISLQASCSIYH